MGTGRDSLEVRDPRPAPAAPPRAEAAEATSGVPAQTDENVVTCFIDGAATLKRARKQGLLRPVAPRPLNARVARRRRRFERPIAVARAPLQFDFVLMLCRRLGVKDVFLFATEAGAPAWLTLGFEHVGSSASLIHLRFDLLFKRDRGDLLAAPSPPRASSAPAPAAPSPSALADASSSPPRPGGAVVARRGAPRGRAAGAGAAPPRHRVKRVVDDADADDEDEAWEPGRPSMMDLDDGEQEQAAKAKRKLKRRGEGWEESDEDDPVEDLIHRERIRERDLLRTPGCLALGRKAFRLEDMPRVTERDREILRRVLYILREAERRLQRLFPNHDFRLSWSVRFNVVVQTVDAIALDSNLELTRVDMEVRRSTVGVYEDSLACQLLGQTYYVHPDKTIKITVDLVVTSEVIGAFPRTAPGRAEVQIKELGFHFIDPLAPIAEKEIVPRVRVFIPYLGIEGWISITLDDGHLIVELKYLQAMHVKNRMLKCCYTLYLLELADRLRGEASRETLKTARKNVVEVRSRVRERASATASSP
ncbi:hypothetical protein JL722_5387 [Aureococcus anophagefferens]|nr:hypothetical protein JL722_5387 [Aureococcus anophagefferens]